MLFLTLFSNQSLNHDLVQYVMTCVCFPGSSEAILESEFQREQAFEDTTEKEVTSPMPDDVHESVNAEAVFIQRLDDLTLDENPVESCRFEKVQPKALPLSSSGQESVVLDDILDDMELGDLFLEDVPPYVPSPHELLELQKKEIMRELCNEKNLGKLKSIWKKVTLHLTRS